MSEPVSDGAAIRQQLTLEALNAHLSLWRANSSQVETFVRGQVEALVSHARTHTPFYADLYRELPNTLPGSSVADALSSLPRVTREMVQQGLPLMQWRAPGEALDRYSASATSGSTGKPVTVYKHRTTYQVGYDAVTLLDWIMHERRLDSRVAFLRALLGPQSDGFPIGPPVSYLGHTGDCWSLSIVNESIGTMLDAVQSRKPDYIYCNAVVLRQLALEQIVRGGQTPVVDRFITVSDRIDSDLRTLAREVFGASIEDRYSTEEVGYIALQCPVHDHLHVVASNVWVEVLRDDNSACVPGETGRVVVTSLHNTAQPMIRYEVGDFARVGAPCAAGFAWPVIEEVVGRERDVIRDANGSIHMVTVYDSKLTKLEKMRDFQVMRFDNSVVVVYFSEPELTSDERQSIEEDIQSMFHTDDPVHLLRSDSPAWRGLHKRREWDRAIGDYDSAMTLDQVLAAARRD